MFFENICLPKQMHSLVQTWKRMEKSIWAVFTYPLQMHLACESSKIYIKYYFWEIVHTTVKHHVFLDNCLSSLSIPKGQKVQKVNFANSKHSYVTKACDEIAFLMNESLLTKVMSRWGHIQKLIYLFIFWTPIFCIVMHVKQYHKTSFSVHKGLEYYFEASP